MVFFATSRQLYGFLLNNERFALAGRSLPTLVKQMQTMLRDMGNYQAEPRTDPQGPRRRQVEAVGRKAGSRYAAEGLAGRSLAAVRRTGDRARRRAVVSAVRGAAGEGQGRNAVRLISRFRIRYAPTLSLATSQGRAATRRATRPWWWASCIRATRTPWPGRPSSSSPPWCPAPWRWNRLCRPRRRSTALLFDRLVVLDDIVSSDHDPYGWALVPVDRGKPGASLGDWLTLPWGGPDVVVLPGFHTAAEDALKRPHRSLPGNEVFLAGLRPHGQRRTDRALEPLADRRPDELRPGARVRPGACRTPRRPTPGSGPSCLSMDSRLNLDAEPRVKHWRRDESPKAKPSVLLGRLHADRLRHRGRAARSKAR